MGDVQVGLNFIEKGSNLDAIKKELKEIAKIASTQVRLGMFDKNAFGDIKAEIEIEKQKMNTIEASTKKYAKEIEKRDKLRQKELQSVKEMNKSIADAFGMMSVAIGYGLLNNIKALLPLEKQMFDLGVIANVSSGQIEELRSKVLLMGSTMPFATAEIAKALNEVARTGKSLEESFAIVDKASKLAVSSGKNIARKILLCWKPLRVA